MHYLSAIQGPKTGALESRPDLDAALSYRDLIHRQQMVTNPLISDTLRKLDVCARYASHAGQLREVQGKGRGKCAKATIYDTLMIQYSVTIEKK